jgi:transglutaminase-like putative cysteine protease
VNSFLLSTAVVDWTHPAVQARALLLARSDDASRTAKACFEFVRDEIKHSYDHRMDPVTCRASDVLLHGTGYCFAKSHLLAALLRANGIPAGFCYQRLSLEGNGPPFTLHGFNAVHLPRIGWYRADARGNKKGVDAQWTPPEEHLAFTLELEEECEFENVFPEPLDCVVAALQASTGWEDALARLPDVELGDFERLGLVVRRTGTKPQKP